MTHDDLQQMDSALEQMLVCGDLNHHQQALVERCLDQGYLMLTAVDKSMIRRLLNTQSSRSKQPQSQTSPLQRWRQRRQQKTGLRTHSSAAKS